MKLHELKDVNFRHYSTQINKIVKKNSIVVVTSYVTIITHRLKYMPQGTKVTVITEKNYRPKYQYTIYFNHEGDEVTRKEFYTKATQHVH